MGIQELLAACSEGAQPAPGLIDRFGEVAAQLCGQPRDQHSALVVGLVGGQVLALAGPEVSIGCTHTNDMPRSAASWPSTRHRRPVGSQATVTPA